VADYLDSWFAEKTTLGYKPATLIVIQTMLEGLRKLFATRLLSDITIEDARSYRSAMQSRGLRPARIARRLGRARQVFSDAVWQRLIAANPFERIRVRSGNPAERRVYVSVADTLRVIEHCPNVWWRLLVALARFGGLRIPSEAFSLTWGDIDWEQCRLTVPSPKTEGQGKPYRVIPIFPLLPPYLDEAFDAAEVGSEYVFPYEYRRRAHEPGGWRNANLRTTLAKIIRRAGVEPWPKLWHNGRASCESDLAAHFPLAVVTKWLGNTPSIALRHYVDPTDAAFQQATKWISPEVQAAQNPAQQGAEMAENIPRPPFTDLPQHVFLASVTTGCNLVQRPQIAEAGFEPARG